MTNHQKRLFKMSPMQAADALYQGRLVPLFADKKVRRPDKFRAVRLFVDLKTQIQKGAGRAEVENLYRGLVAVINEIKGGSDGKRKN